MSFEEENRNSLHLEELNGSDYQIVEGEPDITGWTVLDGQNRVVGEVDDVLFDTETRDVRYIIVDLAENELNIDVDKKVLVPIGIAELRDDDDDTTEDDTLNEVNDNGDIVDDEDFDDDVVYLPSVTAELLLTLPAYEKGEVTADKEIAIRGVFETSGDSVTSYEKDSFYAHDHFNNRIYPKRDVPYSNAQADRGINPENNTDRDTDRTIF